MILLSSKLILKLFLLGGTLNASAAQSTNETEGTDSRIVGGKDVSGPGVYPFMVQVKSEISNAPGDTIRYDYLCGGSLIAPTLVLTSAACVSSLDTEESTIVGTRVLVNPFVYGSETLEGVELRFVTKAEVHPRFNEDTFAYDFQVLTLDKPVKPVKPIKISARKKLISVGDTVKVLGFGVSNVNPVEFPSVLQEVDLPVVQDSRCEINLDPFSTKTMFCAGVNGGGKGPCIDDAGGPVFTMKNGKPESLVGLVSNIGTCSQSGHSDIRLARDWLLSRDDCAEDVKCNRFKNARRCKRTKYCDWKPETKTCVKRGVPGSLNPPVNVCEGILLQRKCTEKKCCRFNKGRKCVPRKCKVDRDVNGCIVEN